MSAFPSIGLGQATSHADDAVRRIVADATIEASRESTPTPVKAQRISPRMTVSEMNDLDMGALRERYYHTPYDDRGSVTRVLDMLDMPRKAIVNTIFSGTRKRLERERRFEPGGGIRVNGSDVLRDFGISNNIAAAVGGLVLDIAFDPLTYVGASGGGFRLAGKGVRGVRGGLRGERALRKAIRVAARGGEIADKETADLIRAAGFTNERIAELAKEFSERAAKGGKLPARNARRYVESKIRAELFGTPDADTLSKALRPLGGELEYTAAKPGLLARAVDRDTASTVIGTADGALAVNLAERDSILAAQAWLKKYGKGADGPIRSVGIRLGSGGSQILHIPFTEIGLSVPAFTAAGRRAERVQSIARAGGKALSGSAAAEKVTESLGRFIEAQDAIGRYRSVASDLENFDMRATEASANIAAGVPGEDVAAKAPSPGALGAPTPGVDAAPIPEAVPYPHYSRAPVQTERAVKEQERAALLENLGKAKQEVHAALRGVEEAIRSGIAKPENFGKVADDQVAEMLMAAKVNAILRVQARDIELEHARLAGEFSDADKHVRTMAKSAGLQAAQNMLDDAVGNRGRLMSLPTAKRMRTELRNAMEKRGFPNAAEDADRVVGHMLSEAFANYHKTGQDVEEYLLEHFDDPTFIMANPPDKQGGLFGGKPAPMKPSGGPVPPGAIAPPPPATAQTAQDVAQAGNEVQGQADDVVKAGQAPDATTVSVPEPDEKAAHSVRGGGEWAEVPAPKHEVVGTKATLRLADGSVREYEYVVLDADDVYPSHNPFKGWAPDPLGDLNERPYDHFTQGREYRQTAQRVGDSPDPALLLTDTPTVTDGPPVVTGTYTDKTGKVIHGNRAVGGNARTMGMMLMYHGNQKGAAAYRAELLKRAGQYGLDAAAIEKIEKPILVRRLMGKPEPRGELSRVLNESLTTAKNRATDAISRGRLATPETLTYVAEVVGDGTLREAMADPKASRQIVQMLVQDGVLSRDDLVRLMDNEGNLNAAGKLVIEDTLLGAVMQDVEAIASASASTRNTLLRSAPDMVWVMSQPAAEGLDLRTSLSNAIDGLAAARDSGARSFTDLYLQESLIPEPWRADPVALALVRSLMEDKPTAFAQKMKLLRADMEMLIESKNQGVLMGAESLPTPRQSFDGIFNTDNIRKQLDRDADAGLFGQKVIRKNTGKQGELPLEWTEHPDARRPWETAEEHKLRLKWKESERRTGMLFTDDDGQGRLFQMGRKKPRGEVMFVDDKARILLRQGAGFDTVLHELAHVTLRRLDKLDRQRAIAAIEDAMAAMTPGAVVKPRALNAQGRLTKEAEEVFALGVEAYFKAGRAPSPVLADFYNELSKTARRTMRSIPDGALPDSMAKALDDLFGEAWQQEVWAAANEYAFRQYDAASNAHIRLSDEAFKTKSEKIPDMLSRQAALMFDYADASRAGVREVINRRDGFDKQVVEIAKWVAGVDDDTLGLSIMAPMSNAARALSGNPNTIEQMLRDLNASLRRTFGNRNGIVHDILRQTIHASTDGYATVAEEQVGEFVRRLRELMDAHGVPEKHFGDVLDGVTALMVHRRMNTGSMWGSTLKWNGSEFEEVAHPIADRLNTLKGLGLLNPSTRPGWIEAMGELAEENLKMLDDLGEQAVQRGLMEDVKSGYVTNRLTTTGQNAFDTADRSSIKVTAKSGAKPGPKAATKESFQKARTTDQYRFIDADGKTWRFFEFERAYTSIPRKDLDPYQLAIRDKIEEYDAMVKAEGLTPEMGRARYARPTDPFELNRLSEEEGAFKLFTGNQRIPLYVTNAATLMGFRYADQARANAIRTFHDLMREHGLDLDAVEAIKNMKADKVVHLRDGGTARLIEAMTGDKEKRYILDIGGIRYRSLRPDIYDASRLGPLSPGVDRKGFERWYPEQVAEAIERYHETWIDSSKTNALLSGMEEVTKLWKMATLTHPSWVIINGVGSVALLMQSGMMPQDWIKHFGKAVQAVLFARRAPERLGLVTADIGGAALGGEELYRLAQSERVFTGQFGKAVAEMKGRDMLVHAADTRKLGPLDVAGKARRLAAVASEQYEHAMNQSQYDSLAAASSLFGSKTATRKAKAAMSVVNEVGVRRMWGGWFRMNQMFEDSIRMAAFMAAMEKGSDPRAAATFIRQALFDFGDYTGTEGNIRRYLMPFYSWFRNNTAYQARMLIENPKSIAALPKLQEALEEAFAGESQVPRSQRPRWMLDQLAIQIGKDPTDRSAMMGLNVFPQGDAAPLLAAITGGASGAQELANYFASSLNPVIRAPLEIAAGREFFSSRDIGPSDGGGDITMGEHLLGQIRPIREAKALKEAAGRGPGAAVGRFLGGGRYQSFTEERIGRQKIREFQERERLLRAKIRKADRDGDEGASLDARSKLMRLYRVMVDAGLDHEVPKWVLPQLHQIEAEPVSQ